MTGRSNDSTSDASWAQASWSRHSPVWSTTDRIEFVVAALGPKAAAVAAGLLT